MAIVYQTIMKDIRKQLTGSVASSNGYYPPLNQSVLTTSGENVPVEKIVLNLFISNIDSRKIKDNNVERPWNC